MKRARSNKLFDEKQNYKRDKRKETVEEVEEEEEEDSGRESENDLLLEEGVGERDFGGDKKCEGGKKDEKGEDDEEFSEGRTPEALASPEGPSRQEREPF